MLMPDWLTQQGIESEMLQLHSEITEKVLKFRSLYKNFPIENLHMVYITGVQQYAGEMEGMIVADMVAGDPDTVRSMLNIVADRHK